jgi:hypothetical protein
MSPKDEEDVIRHDVRRTGGGGLGLHGERTPATSGKRTVPAPWVDCEACARRHYPSTIAGRWHIPLACLSCGAALPDGR